MVAALNLAISGATGFVGARLLDLALAQGHEVRALARRPQPPRRGVRWFHGALDQPDALAELVSGADSVIHVAGVINARDGAGFEQGNVAGTAAMVAAAQGAGCGRFVHVSSLAAREPGLSLYGASKSRSEDIVRGSGLSWAIVRPPAVYGAGDRETLELFRMARAGLILLPPSGRLSLIHVDDLARLLLALADPGAPDALLVEPDDGRPGGWSHREFAALLAAAFRRRAMAFSTPRALVRMGATIDRWLRGDGAKLTADRASYFCHPDWVCSPKLAPPPELWHPEVRTPEGVVATARWYEAQGWL